MGYTFDIYKRNDRLYLMTLVYENKWLSRLKVLLRDKKSLVKSKCFSQCCSIGDLETCIWMVDHFRRVKWDLDTALWEACRNGHLLVAQWLTKRFKLNRKEDTSQIDVSFQSACSNGQLVICKWISKEFLLGANVPRLSFVLSCQKGHLSVVQWLTEHFHLVLQNGKKCNITALEGACFNGYLSIVEWIVKQFSISVEDVRSGNNFAFKAACISGHLHVAQWLAKTFPLITDEETINHAYQDACSNNQTSVVNWLNKRFKLTLQQVMPIPVSKR